MRSIQTSLAFTFTLLLASAHAWGQATATPLPAAAVNPSAGTNTSQESRTERIRVEDEGARIDELRIGGETRTISVTPKGGMPAYDVAPKTGERTWKVLGF